MTTIAATHRRYGREPRTSFFPEGRPVSTLLGLGLIGVGVIVLVDPDLSRGGSLVLLGVAVLEQGSARVRRAFTVVSERLDLRRP